MAGFRESPDWINDCMHWRKRVLTGRYAHWCQDWDGLPIDETTLEWPCNCADRIEEKPRMIELDKIPDRNFYHVVFSPWDGYGEFADFYNHAEPHTIISADRCYVLYSLARQALRLTGDFWECGVYKGGTAAMLAKLIRRTNATLHLFDTFRGMPKANPDRDWHQQGDFADTSLEAVKAVVGTASYHPGFIPDTFDGLERSKIALAHIDVDLYQSVLDCCRFIYPRIVQGGFMLFDDYGFASCPGARAAVDEYFVQTSAFPLVLPTGQAIVFKGV